VRFEGREPYRVVSRVWVRKESERIGIRREEGRVSVPGFLICDNQTSVARLGAGGRLVVPITREQPARLDTFTLPPGRWRVEVEASGRPVRLVVSALGMNGRGAGGQGLYQVPPSTLLDAPAPAVLDWDGGDAGLRVELFAQGDETVEIHRLTFTRVGVDVR
jgi:hypothetical protein